MLKMFKFETHMDFVGQHNAEKYSRLLVTIFGIAGLIWGAVVQQFSYTVYTLGVGFLLASVLTVPPWPMFRRHPLNWQKPRPEHSAACSNSSHEETSKPKKKK